MSDRSSRSSLDYEMRIAWGLALIVLGLLAWVGQAVSWFRPEAAARMGLTEREDSVEPAFWADARGEALWDTLTLWTLPVAGLLVLVDAGAWAYFGLAGGGSYLYFAGRGVLTRIALRRRRLRIGTETSVRSAYAFLSAWGLLAIVTIIASINDLTGP